MAWRGVGDEPPDNIGTNVGFGVKGGRFQIYAGAMTLIGTAYLVYLPTPTFRETMAEFVEPDDFGSIYSVRQGHPDNDSSPARAALSAAHWSMFLFLLKDDFPELRQTALARGFDACWEVHSLDIEAGDDAVVDAKALPAC